jgi:hypothetical protein
MAKAGFWLKGARGKLNGEQLTKSNIASLTSPSPRPRVAKSLNKFGFLLTFMYLCTRFSESYGKERDESSVV